MKKIVTFALGIILTFGLQAQNFIEVQTGAKLTFAQQHQVNIDPVRWRIAPDYNMAVSFGRKFKNDFELDIEVSYSSSSVSYNTSGGFGYNLKFPFKATTNIVGYGLNLKMPILLKKKYQFYSLFGAGFNIIYTDNFRRATINEEIYAVDTYESQGLPPLEYKLVFSERYNSIERQNISLKAGVTFDKKIINQLYFTSTLGFHVGMSNLITRTMFGKYYIMPDNIESGNLNRIYIYNKGDHIFCNIGVKYFINKDKRYEN
ncbi:MAG: hypothetical protein ACPGXZ_00920 [Saprospiraceae bacterium]